MAHTSEAEEASYKRSDVGSSPTGPTKSGPVAQWLAPSAHNR